MRVTYRFDNEDRLVSLAAGYGWLKMDHGTGAWSWAIFLGRTQGWLVLKSTGEVFTRHLTHRGPVMERVHKLCAPSVEKMMSQAMTGWLKEAAVTLKHSGLGEHFTMAAREIVKIHVESL